MDELVVAAAALNQTPLAWQDNRSAIERVLLDAWNQGAQIVCLPELCITGYGCEDAFHSAGIVQEALACAQEIARNNRDVIFSLGLPLQVNGVTYNTVALVAGGEIRGFVAKQNLAGDGLHYEPRWFKPWPKGMVSAIRLNGRSIPVGDLLFDIDGLRVGFEICEDAWVAERVGINLAQSGADLILNPSASHFAFGKQLIRERLVLEASKSLGVAYIYANLLGCEAGRIIYDGDTLIASHGEMVARGPRFSYRDYVLTLGMVNIKRSRLMRRRRDSIKTKRALGKRIVKLKGVNLNSSGAVERAELPEWELSHAIKHEEFTRAVSLGLFDYLRKSRSQGFVVSLSGGVDSSAVSVLVALMVKDAIAQLGLAEVKNKLQRISGLKALKREEEFVRKLLACVYQRSANSSKVTQRAAEAVAQEIGAEFFELDISEIVKNYEDLITAASGVKLSWREHDLARQNVQARVRSPSVWLIANIRKALLLTTSNRSEAAVGYTTMDGDSSGGLSPLGGIDKAFLRRWLIWMEREGPSGLTRFASLRLVNKQEPTAELRPLKEKQTDEKDLMPYEVLDQIERLAIRDKLLPLDIAERLTIKLSGRYSKRKVCEWIERFFRLWSANQWKRERYAPSFHLDDESLDPKTWCRFPILSGGFDKELADLKAWMSTGERRRKR
jgi:NAD+ synthase (glutamine-hydrolysing)